ncbi:MAG: helix-turn-helix domain-containing protein [Steroidobacter sp.]
MSRLSPLAFQRFAFNSALGAWEFLIAPPPADLAGVVEAFWISRGCVTFLHEKVLPQNNVELMFNLLQPFGVPNRPPVHRRFKRAWVAGMQRDWLMVTPQYDPTEPSYLLSARMPPLGAYRVLGLPMGQIAQNVLELDDVLGDEVNAVHERLGEQGDVGLQFAVLCDFVRKRLAASRITLRPDAQIAVDMLLRSIGADRIESICRSLRVSRKHLGALFDAHIGLSPKAYARMFRFRRVVDLVQSGRRLDWSQVAMSCGYYDQSHFNREFREFTGMTPGEFVRAGSVDGLTVVVA